MHIGISVIFNGKYPT